MRRSLLYVKSSCKTHVGRAFLVAVTGSARQLPWLQGLHVSYGNLYVENVDLFRGGGDFHLPFDKRHA